MTLTYVFSFLAMDLVQSNVPEAIQESIQKLEQDLQNCVGGAAAILYQGNVVYLKTIGYEYQDGPVITTETYFALGSVSKPIAAMVVSDLIVKGSISLNSSFEKQIPNIAKGVQLQHILSHTTGYSYKGNADIEKGVKRTEILSKLLKSKLNAKPGEKFLYNNAAYSLVEIVLEKTHGKPWISSFHELLAKKGLEHITIVMPPKNSSVAHPHHYNNNTGVFKDLGPVPRNYPQAVSSSAGAYASLNDLITFAKLQLSGNFDQLHTPRIEAMDLFYWGLKLPRPNTEIRSSYALGWRVLELKSDLTKSSRLVFHGGYLNGVSAFIGLMKKQDLAIVVVVNDDRCIAQKIGMALWSAVISSNH